MPEPRASGRRAALRGSVGLRPWCTTALAGGPADLTAARSDVAATGRARPRVTAARRAPASTPLFVVASAWAFAMAATGCDVGVGLDAVGEGPQITSTSPAAGDWDVARNAAFFVGFDRLLLPQSVSRATVRVHSGERQALVSVRFDPVDRMIVAVPFDRRRLEPRVTYRLVVEDVRDLADRRLSDTVTVPFRTGSSLARASRPPDVAYAEVAPIFADSCVGSGCHGGPDPAVGLDLSSPDGIRSSALGVPSSQIRAGTAGSEGAVGSVTLAGLPIIDVAAGGGQPARSYLVYKLIGDGPILGDIMPPLDSGRPALDHAAQRLVADWILGGAPTD